MELHKQDTWTLGAGGAREIPVIPFLAFLYCLLRPLAPKRAKKPRWNGERIWFGEAEHLGGILDYDCSEEEENAA